MSDSDGEKNSFEAAALSVVEVNAQLPGPGNKIAVFFKFIISWVREALAAVNITGNDLGDHGECKSDLIT